MSVVYLAALLLSLTGLGLLDYRHRLAVGNGAAIKTLVIVGASVAFFLIWDVFGIASGVFFRGGGPWMTGILLAPELPSRRSLLPCGVELFDTPVLPPGR